MLKPREHVDTIDHLDFQPRCEAKSHLHGQWGHVPEQPAKWLVITPCGESRMMCDGWVLSWVAARTAIKCGTGCDGLHPYEEVRRIPL